MNQKLQSIKRATLLLPLLLLLSFAGSAQTTVSINATGTTGSYNTGSVDVNGLKLDGNIDSISTGALPPPAPWRGWAKFDLSSIPVGATITSATLYFTTYNGSTSSGAINTISGFLGSPSSTAGTTLYNDIGAGAVINSSTWTANGLQTQLLNSTGVSFLQTNIGGPVNVGFMRAGYLPYFIYGYPASSSNQPRLDITYTVSNQCASITSVSATGPSSVCAGTSFNLASATSPAATGFTFQWQSSPAGTNTWTNITGATSSTYSTSQSSATDYRLLVTCPATSANGTSNTVAVAQNNFNTCYCPATVGYVGQDEITNVLLGTINNTTTCGSLVGSQGTAVGGVDIYSNFTGSTVPVPNLMQGISQTLSVDLSSCGAGSTTREVKAYIDYNQNGLFTDLGEEIIVYPYGNPNSSLYTATVNFTVPATATLGTTRMRIILGQGQGSIVSPCSVYLSYGEAEDYTVNIVQAVACSGQPTAGTASGPASVCAGQSFTVSLALGTAATGLTIQWQSSPAGTNTWTSITGATNASYAVTTGQTAATDYRAVVTCTNGGGSDISNTVAVAMSPFYLCYCSPNNGVSLNSTNTYNYLQNVTILATSLNNSSTTGGYTFNYPTNATNTTTLTQGVQYTINTTHAFGPAPYNSFLWIDYDGSGTFDAGEYTALTTNNVTGTATFTVPLTATPGVTGMRVRHYYGTIANTAACSVNGSYETEDYIITIAATTACVGQPSAGTAASNVASACNGTSVTLSLTGYTVGSGITLQWYSSPAGMGNWTAITGATNASYTLNNQAAATDYRAIITCTNGGASDISNAVAVGQSPFYACYCSPLTGIALNGTNAYNYLSNVNISGTSLFSSTTTSNGYTQFYPTAANTTTDLSQGVQYTINTVHAFTGGYVSVAWIDYDQSGTFDASEYILLTSNGTAGTATFTVPLTAVTGLTGLRVRHYFGAVPAGSACSVNGSYETEDYVINILASPPCSGTPLSGTASGPTGACTGVPFNLTLTGYTIGQNITVSWESSPSGMNTWTAMTGQTNPVAAGVTQTAATDYRAIVTCNGTSSATSNTITVTQNVPTQCYCIPGATNPNASDHIMNVTFAGINNSTAAGNASGYNDYTSTISPASVTPGSSYTFSMVIANGGTEYGGVWFDWDQSGTFDASEFTNMGNGQTPTVLSQTITVPGTAPLGTTRMRVRSKYAAALTATDPCSAYTYGETEDYSITVSAGSGCIAPGGLAATNITTTSANVGWSTAVNAVGYEWAVDQTSTPAPAGSTIINSTSGVSATATGLSGGTTYYLHVRSNCGATSSSWAVLSFSTPPVNDPCANAITVTNTSNLTGITTGATQSMTPCDATLLANDVWYMFTTGSVGGSVTVNVNTSVGDIVLEAFSGTCGSFTPLTATASSAGSSVSCIDWVATGLDWGTYTVLANTTYYVRVYGYNSANSTFTISASGTPLAIKLLNIQATNAGSRNRIDWTTSQEATGDYMMLQRSIDGNNFTDLSKIDSKGQASAYTYWDETPVTGVNQYRLKMYDAAGNFEYSRTVSATVKTGTFTVEAYPNPVSEILTVKVYGVTGTNATITVTDVTGKIVKVVAVESSETKLSMSNLAAGSYLIKYSDNDHSQVIKVNKQ
jgi:hypothetical protein